MNINHESYTSSDDYSTEETVIGTWIDGKPIYRKAGRVTFGLTTSSQVTLDSGLTSSYVENIINCGGSGRNNDDGNVLAGGPYYPQGGRISFAVKSAGLVLLNDHVKLTYLNWWVEYTKTTD